MALLYGSQERAFAVVLRKTKKTILTSRLIPELPAASLGPPATLSGSPRRAGCAPCCPSHRDDIVLAEAQLVVVVALEVQQGLGAAPAVAGAGHVVLVVPLVALHAVVRGQVLARTPMQSKEE